MEKVNTYIKENLLQILIIIIGAAIMFIPAFHSNIWFDESYTVGLMNHSFADIWNITASDVHPPLYYWILKLVSLIFGETIMIYRIFSIIPLIVMGILGLTHISKDFGKKVGTIFSFLTFFLPIVILYASEIRMYTLAMLIVTIAGIYLYRFIKEKNMKNIIIFAIFSLLSCYTHYYGVVAMGIINLGLIIYVITKRKELDKKILITFILAEILQVLIYFPWMIELVGQIASVSGGFWISMEFPKTLIEILNFQFSGGESINTILVLISAVVLYGYTISLAIKAKIREEEYKVGAISLVIYILVILAVFIASLIMSPILYDRYLFTISGFLIFGLSYFLAKNTNKYILAVIGTFLVIGTLVTCVNMVEKNYDINNKDVITYIDEIAQNEDTIIFKGMSLGGITSVTVENENQYFANLEYWGIEEAYKAYSPNLKITYDLKDVIDNSEGKIILLDNPAEQLLNKVLEIEGLNITVLEKQVFKPNYQNEEFNIIVVDKV